MENSADLKRVAQFLYEVGTMRKVARMHRQLLLTDDISDNIATHSFRVAVIGVLLAGMEGVDPAKVMMMCLVHDIPESRSNDHNWIHKRYVAVDEDKIIKEQACSLPDPILGEVAQEYRLRQSRESIVAKDADILDQILLLREYFWQGNKEAEEWLEGKRSKQPYNYTKYLFTESAKALGKAIYDEEPSGWWRALYQRANRPIGS